MPYKGAYSLRGLRRSLHAEQLVIAADDPYFPDTQSVQTVLAAAEYLPGRHAWQTAAVVAAETVEYRPASQDVQVDMPVCC